MNIELVRNVFNGVVDGNTPVRVTADNEVAFDVTGFEIRDGVVYMIVDDSREHEVNVTMPDNVIPFRRS